MNETTTRGTHLTVDQIHDARLPCPHCVLKHIGQARALYIDWWNSKMRDDTIKTDPVYIGIVEYLGRAHVLAQEALKGYPHHVAYAVGLVACAEDLCPSRAEDYQGLREYRTRLEAFFLSNNRNAADWCAVDALFACESVAFDFSPTLVLALGHIGEAIDECEFGDGTVKTKLLELREAMRNNQAPISIIELLYDCADLANRAEA